MAEDKPARRYFTETGSHVLERIIGSMETLTGLTGVVFFPEDKAERNRFLLKRMGHKNPFCELMKRKQFSTCVRCCNTRRDERSRRLAQPFIDECDFGVTELVVPIVTDKGAFASLSLGQLMNTPDRRRFRQYVALKTRAAGLDLNPEVIERITEHFHYIPLNDLVRHGELFFFALSYAGFVLDNNVTAEAVRIRKNHLVYSAISHLQGISGAFPTQKEMASRLGVSSEYLSRLFRNTMGRPYSEYVNELRISRAQGLLKTTFLSINEIAAEVGFARHSYFSRRFRLMTGLSPQQYRDSHRAAGVSTEPPR